MPRDLPIGNGTLLAAFDFDYQLRDLYFPRVGKENHALGHPWRLGVWVNGRFSWVGRAEWTLSLAYVPDALVTQVRAVHPLLGLTLECRDAVDYESDILIRHMRVRNTGHTPAEVKIFFHADLNVLENETGDTVFFDPKNDCLIHYKGPRYFLMGCATPHSLGVTEYATGSKRSHGREGTWRDAEDGMLGRNPIAQGAVDSVIGVPLSIAPGDEETCHYWLAAGRSYSEVEALHRSVARLTPEHLIERNVDYWRRWLSSSRTQFHDLPPRVVECYKSSLLILRTQIDNGGAVIAANDTDILQFNQDTYSYMWPRDGAVAARALDRAGYGALAARFLKFCTQDVLAFNYSANVLSESGFLMHKYNPDGSVGSSWQPWIWQNEMQLPIQEDETALVIWAIWHHYVQHRDIAAVRPFYAPFVQQAADFLLSFRDEKTGLPSPSFDLWEERRGIFAYTVAAVVAGLSCAAQLAELFQEDERAQAYLTGASEVKLALERHLYCPHTGRFARGIVFEGSTQRRDETLDASLLWLVALGGFDPGDSRIAATVHAIGQRLWVKGRIGGLARYENDLYQRAGGADGPGNPWVLCTLWLAQHRIRCARDREALRQAIPLIAWAASRALPSGVLPEQVHPDTGEFLSVSPLSWSHATLVATVLDYLEQFESLDHARSHRRPEGDRLRRGVDTR